MVGWIRSSVAMTEAPAAPVKIILGTKEQPVPWSGSIVYPAVFADWFSRSVFSWSMRSP